MLQLGDQAMDVVNALVNPENEWRLVAPTPKNWACEVRPDRPRKKYFIVSCDTHLTPPSNLFRERLDKKWHDKLPRLVVRDGQRFVEMEGARPERLIDTVLHGEDDVRAKAGASLAPDCTDSMSFARIAEQARDGVDGEVIFPNGQAAMMWASSNSEFVTAQCAIWNDWAWEVCSPHKAKCNPVAALNTADIEGAVKEVQRVAKLGYRALTLPCKPIWGPHDISHINYNLPIFDPLWAAVRDVDLTMTFHVSTGKDPRAARGNGGAVINYVVHSLAPTIEPIVSLCASGVFERFPSLRAATIEADAGWVPWMLLKMDEAYKKHHMWVRPKMKALPSDYYRANCYASFGEDTAAVALAEMFGLEDNLMWANDYPHHEGSWPHSAEAIERTFQIEMKEETRAKLLGLNAAKVFRFDVPTEYSD